MGDGDGPGSQKWLPQVLILGHGSSVSIALPAPSAFYSSMATPLMRRIAKI
jgi:hypothetical protein